MGVSFFSPKSMATVSVWFPLTSHSLDLGRWIRRWWLRLLLPIPGELDSPQLRGQASRASVSSLPEVMDFRQLKRVRKKFRLFLTHPVRKRVALLLHDF